MTVAARDVTRMLLDWSRGDARAAEQLFPLVYEELHRLAARQMRRERADHTLQATALVNEAYLAEPRAFFRCRGPIDAAHSHQARRTAACRQTGRGGAGASAG
jgi:ECF sigma factor